MKYVYVPNDRKPVVGSIRLLKLEKCSPNKVLSGAVFALFLWSEDAQQYALLRESPPTGTDGTLVIENLAVGKYKLVETVSPPGYLRDLREISVEIGLDDTGTIVEPERIVVYNEAMPSCCCNCCCCCNCYCCCDCHCDRRYYCPYCGCYHYYDD